MKQMVCLSSSHDEIDAAGAGLSHGWHEDEPSRLDLE